MMHALFLGKAYRKALFSSSSSDLLRLRLPIEGHKSTTVPVFALCCIHCFFFWRKNCTIRLGTLKLSYMRLMCKTSLGLSSLRFFVVGTTHPDRRNMGVLYLSFRNTKSTVFLVSQQHSIQIKEFDNYTSSVMFSI